jgi:hypothetical protein
MFFVFPFQPSSYFRLKHPPVSPVKLYLPQPQHTTCCAPFFSLFLAFLGSLPLVPPRLEPIVKMAGMSNRFPLEQLAHPAALQGDALDPKYLTEVLVTLHALAGSIVHDLKEFYHSEC